MSVVNNTACQAAVRAATVAKETTSSQKKPQPETPTLASQATAAVELPHNDSEASQLARAWQVAATVPDPELPFLNIADLGILRDIVIAKDGTVIVKASPTYTGCPAVNVIEKSIQQALHDAGIAARVERQYSPAWSSSWITKAGREKLRTNGIAPPSERACDGVQSSHAAPSHITIPVFFANPRVCCPACGSDNSRRVSEFGSTPCKAHYQCNHCMEPFDYFKCI